MPNASASTASVNSSREPVRTVRARSQGSRCWPRTSMMPMNSATLIRVSRILSGRLPLAACTAALVPAGPLSALATAGSSTRASTMTRSSTTKRPTAALPVGVSSSLRSSKARNRTTVLATASARPKTRPVPNGQLHTSAITIPHSVPMPMWTKAAGTATRRTARRSATEKCRPTPNIRRITPSSANSLATSWSPTRPGVNGPRATPARR